MSGLTEFQAEVARLFFSLPASEGFLLARGSALDALGHGERRGAHLVGVRVAVLDDPARQRVRREQRRRAVWEGVEAGRQEVDERRLRRPALDADDVDVVAVGGGARVTCCAQS